MPGEPPSAEGPRAFPIFLSLICYRKEGRSPTWVRRSRMLRRTSPRRHPLLGMPAGILPPSFPIYCCGPSFLRFPCPLRFSNFHKEISSICGNPFSMCSLASHWKSNRVKFRAKSHMPLSTFEDNGMWHLDFYRNQPTRLFPPACPNT